MNAAVKRALAMVELLSARPEGLSLSDIAAALDLPLSAAHRLLNQLVRSGYASQERAQGQYTLTMKMAALGLGFLRRSRIQDVSQPVLDRLAQQAGELVRMAVVDAGHLVFVGVAQGATSGLRYDPEEDQGVFVHLASSASGMAWLASKTDEEALRFVAQQGFSTADSGPNVAATAAGFLQSLHETRARGYAMMVETYCAGMNTMAACIAHPQTGVMVGTVSISGPSSRLRLEQMHSFGPRLLAASAALSAVIDASGYFPPNCRARA